MYYKSLSLSSTPQQVQTSVMWVWWDTMSCLKVLMCWTTTATWWDPQKLLQDMWVPSYFVSCFFPSVFFLWISNVMVADDRGAFISYSAPAFLHLISWEKRWNPPYCSVWNEACAQCSHIYPPGNNGDRLHTCGPADANLRPAPDHHVLPWEVWTKTQVFIFAFMLIRHFLNVSQQQLKISTDISKNNKSTHLFICRINRESLDVFSLFWNQ